MAAIGEMAQVKNMSFSLTTPQIEAKTKTVTRRLGWDKLKLGETLMACEKCQGLGKGGKIRRLGMIRVIGFRKEYLAEITEADVVKEGFPDWTSAQFIEFFCEHNHCSPATVVNRIEFEYL